MLSTVEDFDVVSVPCKVYACRCEQCKSVKNRRKNRKVKRKIKRLLNKKRRNIQNDGKFFCFTFA